jgi:tetratricopeptide (TPR) repeat protein
MKGNPTVMDKYEYRVRLDEIRKCTDDEDYHQAAELADTIDWSRVQSVMTLCMISDIYKINRRFTESRDVLLMAYDRNPNGRLIIYSLCELSIKLNDFVGAIKYFNKFASLAPDDSRLFMLEVQDI